MHTKFEDFLNESDMRYRVGDNPFNRGNYKDMIGKDFSEDEIPSYAVGKKFYAGDNLDELENLWNKISEHPKAQYFGTRDEFRFDRELDARGFYGAEEKRNDDITAMFVGGAMVAAWNDREHEGYILPRAEAIKL